MCSFPREESLLLLSTHCIRQPYFLKFETMVYTSASTNLQRNDATRQLYKDLQFWVIFWSIKLRKVSTFPLAVWCIACHLNPNCKKRAETKLTVTKRKERCIEVLGRQEIRKQHQFLQTNIVLALLVLMNILFCMTRHRSSGKPYYAE